MANKRLTTTPDWSAATAHLAAVDPIMGDIIARVGPCTLSPRTDYFANLARAIYSQQISGAVAAALFAKFAALFPAKTPTAKGTLALSDADLRGTGLSRQKLAYIRDLAEHFAEGPLATHDFHALSDEEIIDALTAVHGIGRWTAEMFLIFSLNRPDVFPVDDFGIKMNLRRAYGYKKMPKPRTMRRHARPWGPWRTVGTWYLWRLGDLPGE